MVVISSNFEAPAEGVILSTPCTKLVVNDQELGTGTLYITQDNVIWGAGLTPGGATASTVSLLYPTISLHAIQRQPNPALYLQLSYDLQLPELQQSASAAVAPEPEEDEGNEDDDDDDEGDHGQFVEDVEPVSQLRFIPESETQLQEMYNALSTGQALHPDPVMDEEDFYMGEGDDDDYDEDGEDMFEDAEESSAEHAASRLQNMHLSNGNGHHHGK